MSGEIGSVGSMQLDIATTTALVARLAAMADDETFQLESAPTTWRYTPGRYPAADALKPPVGEQPYCVAYRIMYRRQTFKGVLVVGAAYVDIAKSLLAQDALYQVQRYEWLNPWTEYTAGGKGVRGGP